MVQAMMLDEMNDQVEREDVSMPIWAFTLDFRLEALR
jgi:hypothetical protein